MVAASTSPSAVAQPLPVVGRDLDRLASESFDVAIIGGGISGVAIAYEAAARGLKTALIERGDWAMGTTTASTKLIHGGVRYLESYEFSLVREALRERRILLNIAPHLVNTVPFMVPIYKGDKNNRLKVDAGMLAYDLLSYDKNWKIRKDKYTPWRSSLSAKGALALEPELRPENLSGAALYTDGQVDSPSRLTIEFARSAVAKGAAVTNYAEVRGLVIDGGAIQALEVRDLLQGREFQVKAKVVINGAGLWATHITKMLHQDAKVSLAPSKGIHLITRPLTKKHACLFVTKAGRRLMVIPWLGKSLIGTTDVLYKGDINRIRCTVPEVVEMVREVNEVLPSAKLQVEEVIRTYAGCRPLIAKEGVSTLDLSRHWEILDHAAQGAKGVYSVVGGKLTTSRSVAKHVVDRIQKQLGHKTLSPTETVPLTGGDVGPVADEIARLQREHGLDADVATTLFHTHGSGSAAVLQLAKETPGGLERIRPDQSYLKVEVRHAVEREGAQNVTDVALRRTDLGNLGDRDGAGGRVIAAEMQRLMGWSDATRNKYLDQYLDEHAIDPG